MTSPLMILVMAIPLICVTVLVIYMITKVKKLRRDAEEGRKKAASARDEEEKQG